MRASRAAALGATAAAAAWTWPAPAPLVPRLAHRLGIPCRLDDVDGVAITFDDGPHPQGTPAVLEILAAAHATATFYLVGEQVERWPSLAAEIAAAGHEIGLHCFRHRLLLRLPAWTLRDDLDRAAATIADAVGHMPASYRPPYGVFSAAALSLARRRGWSPLLWSRWGRDWEARQTARAIAVRASAGLVPGDVVLLHDADHYSAPGSWRRTAAALPLILETASGLGVPFVPVSQAM